MTRLTLMVVAACCAMLFLGCGGVSVSGGGGNGGNNNHNNGGDNPPEPPPPVTPSGLLQPADLTYEGAFRLPDASGGSSWEWSGDALAYYPGGDPEGPRDGYPGSLFGVGHDWDKQVSEITIPAPVVPAGKQLGAMNTAQTLQPFRDVRAGVGNLGVLQELPCVGMEYLPPQGAQSTGKLYLCWGAHFQEEAENVASHMWCEVGLTGSRGAWWVGNYSPYSVNDYMFAIPDSWARSYTPGK